MSFYLLSALGQVAGIIDHVNHAVSPTQMLPPFCRGVLEYNFLYYTFFCIARFQFI